MRGRAAERQSDEPENRFIAAAALSVSKKDEGTEAETAPSLLIPPRGFRAMEQRAASFSKEEGEL